MFRLPIRSPFDRDSLHMARRLLAAVYHGPPDTLMLNGRPTRVSQGAGWTPVGSMARGLQSASSLGARLRGAPRHNLDLVRAGKPKPPSTTAFRPVARTKGDVAEALMRRPVKKMLPPVRPMAKPVRVRPDAGKPRGG